MSIVVAAVVVVGGIMYVMFVSLSYSGEAARLSQEYEEIKVRVDSAKQRTEEYEHRIVVLQDEIPKQKQRCDRLTRWLDLLKNQKAQVDREKGKSREGESKADREEAVRKHLNLRRGQGV